MVAQQLPHHWLPLAVRQQVEAPSSVLRAALSPAPLPCPSPLPLSPAPLPCQAKLADFGSVREVKSSFLDQAPTAIMGTPGYVDPAYVRSRFASVSADVYR